MISFIETMLHEWLSDDIRCVRTPTARDLKPVYPAKRATVNNIDKSPFIFRLFENQNPTTENKRIMSCFT